MSELPKSMESSDSIVLEDSNAGGWGRLLNGKYRVLLSLSSLTIVYTTQSFDRVSAVGIREFVFQNPPSYLVSISSQLFASITYS